MASSVEPTQPTQATEDSTVEVKNAVVVPSSAPIENGDIKETKTSMPEVPAPKIEEDVLSPNGTPPQVTKATEKETSESTKEAAATSSVSASTDVKAVEIKEVVPSTQDAPSSAKPAEPPQTKKEELKVEEVSVTKVVTGVVSGVAANINNVEVGLAKEVPSTPGKDTSKPSMSDTIEGALRVVEKEAVKGAVETVTTVEAHPELIAEGALAAAVGAASMIQPELLPGAVALVGKMASDAAKNTVIKIATDEGKKVGAAIGKDISDDAAKEKAAKAGNAAPDAAKEKSPAPEGTTATKATPSEAPKDAPKDAPKPAVTPSDLTNGHQENLDKSKPSVVVSSTDSPKTIIHQPTATEKAPVDAPAPVTVVAAAASVSQTTTTTKTTTQEPVAASEKVMANITQESLDELHRKIDSLHEAIQKITETLTLHLPPTPTVESSKQTTAEAVTTEPETVPAPLETPAAPTPETSKADTPEVPTEEALPKASSPKRPSLEKRSSVLGSIGKIFWPFGSASPTKTTEGIEVPTADSTAPKVPTVLVTEVPNTPEIEI